MRDLPYLAKEICGVDYVYVPELAPDKSILDAYKKYKGDWSVYERKFLNLMAERKIEEKVSRDIIDGGCLLCSEATPDHCHRRLVVEYLNRKWGDIEVEHL